MIRIYHNNRCSKSRAALSLLEQHGASFEVIHYLDTPLDAGQIRKLLDLLNIDARSLLRTGEEAYKTLGLGDPAVDDDALIAAMVTHPKLIQRPIVCANGRAVIGRPPEAILAIL
ncbi:arsenate reductase (glutaredoxin) [Dyella sp. A6]|uniref:arsenate reductase (glutaredoxin) n=1 Tax=Dyella aluminiiresistens TaxID=3069105 RepID=UPI002E75B517|nr:arsenate reductase (glutaredoxin) [Dyella sp. A6]